MIESQTHDVDTWYAVYCQPRKERIAAISLTEQLGLMVYLPEMKRRSHGHVQYIPFFPCYLFVRADLRVVTAKRINTMAGVLRLVTFAEEPAPLSAKVIEALRQRVDSFNIQGGQLNHSFRPGDMVRLKGGALHGLEAAFIGPLKAAERVRVLINFLGGPRQVDVHVDLLERTAEALPGRERRTRGKGRRIKIDA
jgi:transcriptional antiterminator RfaH